MKLQRINKKGFLTRDFVQAGILFTGIVALMVLMVGGIADEYDNTDIVSEEFSTNYDQLTSVTDNIETIRKTTTSGSGLSFRGLFDVAFGAAFTGIQLVFSTLTLFGSVMSNFAQDFGVPKAVADILFIIGFSIITVVLIFVWLSSISRGKF